MISEEQISEWERITKTATEGPWVKSKFNNDVVQVGKEIKASGTICKNPRENDAEFIVVAREAIPELITEVQTMKKMIHWFANHYSDLEGYDPDVWIDNVEHEVTKND